MWCCKKLITAPRRECRKGSIMDWISLLNSSRRKDGSKPLIEASAVPQSRTEIERDYDRILFSTPVRRLADKTQVFPMEINDSVRTRLTHSHEVSNLARSIGTDLVFNYLGILQVVDDLAPKRNIPSMLAAIGLAHDLGNPPFGHQGEKAIGKWFEENRVIFSDQAELTDAMISDFVNFEGNAQTFRLVTRLQLLNDDFGLNLTYGTLAALLKYTVPSDRINKEHSSRKKFGYFQSETAIVEDVWLKTGLSEGVRHPLTYIMEACDDIAYSILDAEDSVKKQLVSFSDLISHLLHNCKGDPITHAVIELANRKHDEFRGSKLSPAELNDVSMQMFRVYAISAMVAEVKDGFLVNYNSIMDGSFTQDLFGCGGASILCEELKNFDRANGYNHKSVLSLELQGYNTLKNIMDILWAAIIDRDQVTNLKRKRKNPLSAYVYSRISENYRRIFEDDNNLLPIRYKEAQLLADMVSGMTDSYAITFYNDLKRYI